jgi:sulfoxide reductase heme-binding subunit YedZ
MIRSINTYLRRIPVWALWLAALTPGLWVFWQGLNGALGADPVRALELALGKRGLQLLILSLAVTPLRRFTGVNLLRFRRALWLLAFTYIAAHFLAWLLLDMGGFWEQALRDIAKRPYITIGMAAFALLAPLAATSNTASIRRLGARWRALHKLAYAAALLGAAHYTLIGKTWMAGSLVYLGIVLLLLALRLPAARLLSFRASLR